MRICLVPGCSQKHHAKNLCRAHYSESYNLFHEKKDTYTELLIREVSKILGTTQAQTSKVIDIIVKSMINSLRNKDYVKIKGFGRFDVIDGQAEFSMSRKTIKALFPKESPDQCT